MNLLTRLNSSTTCWRTLDMVDTVLPFRGLKTNLEGKEECLLRVRKRLIVLSGKV